MNKTKWHKSATSLLVRVARELGIPRDERTIRSNKGGNAVGGEVTMSAPKFGVYVHLTCPVNSYGEEDRIGSNYARMASEADPYGTSMLAINHFFQYTTVMDLITLCKKIGGKS